MPITCPICGAEMQEVLELQEPPFRQGWVCFVCWPDPRAFVKAIGRERVISNE